MEFYVGTADALKITDTELSDLLSRVYVDGGFVDAETAKSLLEPASVRARGKLIGARVKGSLELAGIVIIVYPDSPARRLVQNRSPDGETEMHLLAVLPEYRGCGLGKLLVMTILEDVRADGYGKMVLCTQSTMQAAHRLYESAGFERVGERDFTQKERRFLVYEKKLSV